MTVPEDHKAYLRTPFELDAELGEFTEAESSLLMKSGSWLDGLMRGLISPYTDAQKHFVGMCHGEVVPSTDHELVWQKYRMEVLYRQARLMEQGAGVYSYRDIRELFIMLAKMGHNKAQSWLVNEGNGRTFQVNNNRTSETSLLLQYSDVGCLWWGNQRARMSGRSRNGSLRR